MPRKIGNVNFLPSFFHVLVGTSSWRENADTITLTDQLGSVAKIERDRSTFRNYRPNEFLPDVAILRGGRGEGYLRDSLVEVCLTLKTIKDERISVKLHSTLENRSNKTVH